MVRSKETELVPSRLAEARRDAETRLAELRGALRTEIGRAPVRRGWWILILAASAGLAVAAGRSRPSDEGDGA